MKFILFTLLFSAVCFESSSQATYANFKKYYYIYYNAKYVTPDSLNFVANGTGFLIKKNNIYYIVTNYHVYSGFDAIHNKTLTLFDIGLISFDSVKKGENLYHFKIETKREESYEQCIKNEMCPDINFYGIIDADSSSLNFFDLTPFLDRSYFNIEPQKLFCWGFPSNDKKHQPKIAIGTPVNFYNPENKSPAFKLYKFLQNFGIEEGMSGAPVFGVYEKNDKKVVKLYGLVAMGNKDKNSLVIVKAWTIQKMLDAL